MIYRLGKLPAKHDERTLMLGRYLPVSLPPAPEWVDWGRAVSSWPMLANDQLGDCTCAGAGHMIQCWTSLISAPAAITDAEIIAAYEAVSGYRPSDPSSDNGAVELTVLKYWRKAGIAGHRIGAFAGVHPVDLDHVKAAVHLFGGLYIGLSLPLSAQDQDVWDYACLGTQNIPGSWGGHCVNVIGYDAQGLTCVTWGAVKRMTWSFWLKYCDEAYAIISPDFLSGDGETPDGFNLMQLQADLRTL